MRQPFSRIFQVLDDKYIYLPHGAVLSSIEMRHLENCVHALPLNDRLFQAPFYVTHAGLEKVNPLEAYPRSGHSPYYSFKWENGRVLGEFCLSLITSGKGELQTKKGRQSLIAGDAFLYQPGEWHRHRPVKTTGWVNIWIKFNGSLPHRWMRDGSFQLNKNVIKVDCPRLFENQFRHLVKSVDAAGTRNSLQFSWQAIGLLSHFLRDTTSTDSTKTVQSVDQIVDEAMDFIWTQSHNQIGVPEIVSHTGVNRRTLERRFKSVTGSSLLNEIQRCRISRAALLLRETDESIKHIVIRAGFPSYQRMLHAFRKHFRQSPENYRARISGSAPAQF